MEYKPGLVAASLSQGKEKSPASNPLLEQLFSKKSKAVTTIKKTGKKEKKSKKLKTTKNEDKSNSKQTVDVLEKVGDKRKHNEPAATPTITKKAKKDVPTSLGSDNEKLVAVSTTLKKAKKIGTSLGSGIRQSTPIPNDFPFLHESLQTKSSSTQPKAKKDKKSLKKDDDDEEDEMTTRNRKRRNKTADTRTLFVGNCPLTSDKKTITKLFKDYGSIESMRFRCGPAAKLDLPRRAVIIKKEFHEKANSYVCFVVFKEEESAKKALEKNGHILDGLHLRVDLASNFKKHDKKRSVFVGNLPFSVTEEDLRSHFQDCGDINNIRIVRDRQTSIGKGIAYVQFESKDSVMLAKKLNGAEFEGRKLRVMTCTNKPKPEKTVNKSNKNGNKITSQTKSDSRPEKRKIVFAPSNRKSLKSFHEMLNMKKEKRLKMKKKKQGSQKTDGLSSIFGDMSADVKKFKVDNPKFRSKKPKDKKNKAKDKKVKKSKKAS